MPVLRWIASRAGLGAHWKWRLAGLAVAVMSALCSWAALSADPVLAACTSHQCFLERVASHQPVLHVDLTDGFRPQSIGLVFQYRAQSSSIKPGYTCLRYNSDQSNDGNRCTNQFRGAGPAVLANVGPGSNVDHLDYPAPITGDCGRKAAANSTCPQEALADHYWNNQPVIYFYGARDNANQRHYEYWFFYSFNYFVVTQNLIVDKIQGEYDLHEGDLEHIIVYTDAQDRPLVYTFYQHASHTNYRANDPRLDTKDGHVRVYAGHGSHASEIGCGLYDTHSTIVGISTGQRDRTCVRDPYTDNVIGPSATTTYAPRNTALRNLDTANWACFGDRDQTPGRQQRLGQSHDDIGGGSAPQAPLIQSHQCPNLYERRHAASAADQTAPATDPNADAPGLIAPAPDVTVDEDAAVADPDSVDVPTSNAFAGIDSCSDWETPTRTTGFQLLVCNQTALAESLSGASSGGASLSVAEPSIRARTPQATSSGSPAYVTEPDAQALQSDAILDTSPSDVYVSSAQDTADGPVRHEALFSGVSSSSELHVDASGSSWKLIDARGNVIASANPTEVK